MRMAIESCDTWRHEFVTPEHVLLAVSRQGFVFLPAILIMQKLFGLTGIIFAQPFADAVAVLIAVGMFLFLLKDLKAEEKTVSSQTNE